MSTNIPSGSPHVSKRSILPLPTPKSPQEKQRQMTWTIKAAPEKDTVTITPQQSSPTFTPTHLFLAVSNGHSEKMKRILDSGVPVHCKDSFGNQPIHKAAFYGYPDIIRELKHRGADVNALINSNQQTPMHKAAYQGHLKSVKALLELGGNVKAKDSFGNTPLHAAVREGANKVAIELLNAGADVNAPDKEGNTPLHKAAHHGQIDTLRLLARNGGNLDAQNKKGETAIDILLKVRPTAAANVKALRKAAQKAKASPQSDSAIDLQNLKKAAADSSVRETCLKDSAKMGEKTTSDEDTSSQSEDELEAAVHPFPASEDGLESVRRPLHHSVEFNDFNELQQLIGNSQSLGQASNRDHESSPLTEDTIDELSDMSASESPEPNDSFRFVLTRHMPQWVRQSPAFFTAMRRAQDMNGRTQLHHAAVWGDKEAVDQLADTTGLKPAFNIFVGDNEMGRAFVPLGQEENAINMRDHQGRTPLHEAAQRGYWDIAETLLQKGANPFLPDVTGFAPVQVIPWPVEESSPAWPKKD